MIIREARASDLSYVLDSWWRSWADDYARRYHLRGLVQWHVRGSCIAAACRLLAHASVLVACADEDPDTIAGWIAYTGTVLLYCHTRVTLRRTGVATALLAQLPQLKWRAANTLRAAVVPRLRALVYDPEITINRAKEAP